MKGIKKTAAFLPFLLLLIASYSFIALPAVSLASTTNQFTDHSTTIGAGEDGLPEFFKLSSQPVTGYESVRKLPVSNNFPACKYCREEGISSLFHASERYLRSCPKTPVLLTIAVIIFPFDYFW